MNYLAHLALSYPDKDLVIGNFIGDHVKNADFSSYSLGVQNGIAMHRSIDTFTDKHPITVSLRQLLFPVYRHYSRVLVDVYYDHFLACYFSVFHSMSLHDFVKNIHPVLIDQKENFPLSAQQYLRGMVAEQWLSSYETTDGIAAILTKMGNRIHSDVLKNGNKGLLLNYKTIEIGFLSFYPDLIQHSKRFLLND